MLVGFYPSKSLTGQNFVPHYQEFSQLGQALRDPKCQAEVVAMCQEKSYDQKNNLIRRTTQKNVCLQQIMFVTLLMKENKILI